MSFRVVSVIERSVRRQVSRSDAESRAGCPLQGYAFCAKRKAGYRALGAQAPQADCVSQDDQVVSRTWRAGPAFPVVLLLVGFAYFFDPAPASLTCRRLLRPGACSFVSAPASLTCRQLLRPGAYFFDPASGLPLAADISLGTTLRSKDVTTSPVEICTRWIFFEAGSET